MKVINPDDLADGEVVFDQFRDDGWPTCPGCKSDELFSDLAMNGTSYRNEPRRRLHIISGMSCLRCSWRLLPGYRFGGEIEI